MKLPHKDSPLAGWGNAPVAPCALYRLEKMRDIRTALETISSPIIARGLGRSYGDASLQPGGTIGMERMNHCISFDSAQGILRAQAGLSLSDVMSLFIPRGFLPPVIPGTQHVTLGGAFASNVHGKNHFRNGDFAEHVLSVRLTLPSGESIECSPTLHPEIFWATAGGMGMTGIIEEVTLQLMPIRSASLHTVSYQVKSIEDMVAAFEHYRDTSDYMVGWIDHMASGANLGQGVFEAASQAASGEGATPLDDYSEPHSRFSVPLFMPSFLLNRRVMALYNRYRFRHASDERTHAIVDFSSFFHPLDSIGNWNKLYGKRGFLQYQCMIPESPQVAAHMCAFLQFLQERKLFSFLAVVKYHRTGMGYLTFPLQGYSIALDFPHTPYVVSHLPVLNDFIAQLGGRVYLAKDAYLSPDHFRRMYGAQADEWMNIIRGLDPQNRFSSLMSERLQWKNAA